ncbi:hypothetical protein RIF29_12920 [Crotalaria pallida]|uniref:Uncharacterized protein n=1 Tax=Crotalaria pallida TaxID=3830 RepID=A0AAN9INQ2_CROPI
MGAVCSAGVVKEHEEEEELEEGMQKEEENSNVDTNAGEGTSESRSDNGEGRMHINESNLATLTPERGRQVNLRGSFLGRAGGKAVAVLDTLGSGMTTKLNSGSSGFVSVMASKGNKISILAFEVANTITKGAILFQSLSEENVWYLKKEILQSKGVQLLVSTDIEELLSLAEADKREEFNVFSRGVARFGNMCKDPQWHNLDRYFSRLDLDAVDLKELRVEAEKIVQEFTVLTQRTAIVEKLVNIGTYILLAIQELLGNNVIFAAKDGKGPQRLGESGLALHYARIIDHINTGAIRPATISLSTRDAIYKALPSNIKNALSSKVQTFAVMKELSYTRTEAELEKTLQWLVPLATNTTRLHRLGCAAEWANTSHDFSDEKTARESFLIRLQSLYYVDKQKIDHYIIEVLAYLQHLISLMRSRQNTMIQMPARSHPIPKGLNFQSNMIKFISAEHNKKSMGTELTKEDMTLLESVEKELLLMYLELTT